MTTSSIEHSPTGDKKCDLGELVQGSFKRLTGLGKWSEGEWFEAS